CQSAGRDSSKRSLKTLQRRRDEISSAELIATKASLVTKYRRRHLSSRSLRQRRSSVIISKVNRFNSGA
ncbi:MAG TPA: hypothetical protein VMU71_06240, partial [Terracidiphilus sp.]|nr:hypothetical protein [Terracidiphilus sp.]